MKKIGIVIFILVGFFVTSGCDISPVYSVLATDEGIITRDGKIVGGPREPGLHFKIPIIHKVHMVDVHRVRFLSVPLQSIDTYDVKVLWHVKDAVKFFESSGFTGDDKKIEPIIAPVFAEIIDTYYSGPLFKTAQRQTDDMDISTIDLEHMIRLIQESSTQYGLNIVDVQFEKR